MKNTVIAVVVTYNRKELLLECLSAIFNQTYPIHKIVLIDNASTDGTEDTVSKAGYINNEKTVYVKMSVNTGGAGGFYEGLRQAKDFNCDWIWVMDDDTIPSKTCLEELIKANHLIEARKNNDTSIRNTAYFASSIYGPEGEFMNLPRVSKKKSANGYEYWYRFLNTGIINVDYVTFVSVLINRAAVELCGLPCREYFIWGDDSEYTYRLTTFYGDAYFVGKSVAIHKRIGAKALNIDYEKNPDRIKLFHYFYRNNNINSRFYEHTNPIIATVKGIISGFRHLFKPMGLLKFRAIIQGHLEAIVQYHRFKNYINGELKNS